MKPHFTNLLYTVDIGWPHVMLTRPLIFIDADGGAWKISSEFVSDLASIPFGLRWLIPRAGRHNRAAVLHDWLFTVRPPDLTLSQINTLMYQAMKADRVRLTRRLAIRAGLAAGSWLPWMQDNIHPDNQKFRPLKT